MECFYFSRRSDFSKYRAGVVLGRFLYFRNAVVPKCICHSADWSFFPDEDASTHNVCKERYFEFPYGSILIFFSKSDILNCRSAKFIFFGEELKIPVRQCSHFFQGAIF